MAKASSLFEKQVRLDVIFSILWKARRRFVIPMAVTAIVVFVLMCCIPRYYSVKVILAPEYETSSSGGGLSSLASLANIKLNMGGANDAITPTFYPDLIKSTEFIVPLFDAQVQTADGKFSGTYRDYLTKHNKAPFWTMAMESLANLISKKPEDSRGKGEPVDPFRLNKMETEIVGAISASIDCSVDKKTDVITIVTTAQDPLVAAQFADTVKQRLQTFITDYRTRKARNELSHMKRLCASTYETYQKAKEKYAAYCDSHFESTLSVYKTEEEDLENEMQLAFNAYSTAKAQVEYANAKLVSQTPAFTTVQNATVPIKPAGPKRMLAAIGCAILCFFVMSIVIISKSFGKQNGESAPADPAAPQEPDGEPAEPVAPLEPEGEPVAPIEE